MVGAPIFLFAKDSGLAVVNSKSLHSTHSKPPVSSSADSKTSVSSEIYSKTSVSSRFDSNPTVPTAHLLTVYIKKGTAS